MNGRSDTGGWVVIADRGGHLRDALALLGQWGEAPRALVTTEGPEVEWLRAQYPSLAIYLLPPFFRWSRHRRRYLYPPHLLASWKLCRALKPERVLSFGASAVVPFCFAARALGARIFHVECLNQVRTPSRTGRLLYPICDRLFVQWEELLPQYGRKAEYAGWVL